VAGAMARTKEFDERQALVKAMLVFWEKGYEGTSIQDLERAMGLKRTSIYNAFGNKRRLFEQIVACYKESVMAELVAAMDGAPDIREGVRRLLNGAIEMHFNEANPGGCLVVLSVLESEQIDAKARAELEKTLHDMKAMLQSRLNRARKAGELPAKLDAGGMANTIAATLAGMMVLGKANFSKAALKKTVNQVVGLLDG